MKRGPMAPPAGRRGPLSLEIKFFCRFGLRSGPEGSAQAVGFMWSLFRAKPAILDPFQVIFDDLGPNRHCRPNLDLQDRAGDGPLEGVRPVLKAPEPSWHASGPSFMPNGRWEIHFKPNFMFL